MSLGAALGFAGAVIGNAVAPGIGASVGMLAGPCVGVILDPGTLPPSSSSGVRVDDDEPV